MWSVCFISLVDHLTLREAVAVNYKYELSIIEKTRDLQVIDSIWHLVWLVHCANSPYTSHKLIWTCNMNCFDTITTALDFRVNSAIFSTGTNTRLWLVTARYKLICPTWYYYQIKTSSIGFTFREQTIFLWTVLWPQ